MFITQLEYREKSAATNWRRIIFPLRANFTCDDAQLPVQLLQIIAALTSFGRGEAPSSFANAISRMTFRAAHNEYMWFAKSTTENQSFLVDEEELYDKDGAMLMRRAFDTLTVGDAPAEEISAQSSMLAQTHKLGVLLTLQQSFQRVQFLQLTEQNRQQVMELLTDAQHGTLFLLDGRSLSAPLDLSAISRNDIQILTTGCSGLPPMQIIKKGKMISCQ